MSQWVQKTVMVMSAGHSKFRSHASVILKVLFSWQKYGSLLSEIPLKMFICSPDLNEYKCITLTHIR